MKTAAMISIENDRTFIFLFVEQADADKCPVSRQKPHDVCPYVLKLTSDG